MVSVGLEKHMRRGDCLSLKLQLPSCHGESNHPENVSLTMPRQGVLQHHLLPQQLSRQKCMEENSLWLHGKGQIFGMLRLCARPASGTRVPLSMTSLKYFGKLRHCWDMFGFPAYRRPRSYFFSARAKSFDSLMSCTSAIACTTFRVGFCFPCSMPFM